MAMVVAHNSASALALNELNKNENKALKDLKKISSGARITGAGDGASDYAISEKMQVKIRGLSQDIENVQNGRSLLKIGLGAVDDIVDELRCLKELALNSCNDHNTDVDRGILQKEFDARKAHIDSIATDTNYNGIVLLDGRWSKFIESEDYKTTSQLVSQTVDSNSTVSNNHTETLAPVTTIKTVTSPKIITTDVKTETVSVEPTNTDTTEETKTSTDTTTTNTTEGPTTKLISTSLTNSEENVTKEGDRITVVKQETVTSSKAVTTVDITTDTTTTTKVTTTTMTSVKEIEGAEPEEPTIITNGTTEITKSGVYEFAPDYTGTLSISAKEVQLNGPKSGARLNEVYIKDAGVEDLYIKNLGITNTMDISTIAFDASTQNTLHVLGVNSIWANDGNDETTEKAVINAGGGLNIVGGGDILVELYGGGHHKGAIIGSDSGGNCGDISIGQSIHRVYAGRAAVGTSSGAAIGSGEGGVCGNISIGSDSNIEAAIGYGDSNTKSSGAAIGAGSNGGSCKDITIYSGAYVWALTATGYGIITPAIKNTRTMQ